MSLHEKRIEALKFVIEVLENRKPEAPDWYAAQRRIDILTGMLWEEEAALSEEGEKAVAYKIQ